jgi:putative endonuclease
MGQNNELGRKGEELAAAFLIENGYAILERNYRFKKAELDIIARKEKLLAVVEVKLRSANAIENPKDAITAKKIKSMVAATDQYIGVHGLDVEVRFDVMAIIKNGEQYELEHIENAFYHF